MWMPLLMSYLHILYLMWSSFRFSDQMSYRKYLHYLPTGIPLCRNHNTYDSFVVIGYFWNCRIYISICIFLCLFVHLCVTNQWIRTFQECFTIFLNGCPLILLFCSRIPLWSFRISYWLPLLFSLWFLLLMQHLHGLPARSIPIPNTKYSSKKFSSIVFLSCFSFSFVF